MDARRDKLPPDDLRGLGPPVPPEAQCLRTDRFLARSFPFNTRRQWSALCWLGHLLVDGRPVRPAHRLKGGERLSVYHPLAQEPAVDTGIYLVEALGSVIAVYKPGNLPMHESGLFRRRTFGALLAERFGPEWAPVHRLDRETSGIVLCAATPEVRRQLSRAFVEGRIEKRYLAIAAGVTAWDARCVDAPILLGAETRRPRYVVDPGGLPARTEFAVLGRAPAATLLEARPRTGRTNQIRLHAAWTGHSLLGDKVYHGDERVFEAYIRHGDVPSVQQLAGFTRHALHAAEVGFTHPDSGRPVHVRVELPADLAGLWREAATAGKGDLGAGLPEPAGGQELPR